MRNEQSRRVVRLLRRRRAFPRTLINAALLCYVQEALGGASASAALREHCIQIASYFLFRV